MQIAAPAPLTFPNPHGEHGVGRNDLGASAEKVPAIQSSHISTRAYFPGTEQGVQLDEAEDEMKPERKKRKWKGEEKERD